MVLNIPLDFLSCFCHGSQRDAQDCLIYAKLIMLFTPNLEFSPYSEVIHESTTLEVTKGYQRLKKSDNYSFWCFWSFLHFLLCNASDSKCYKQKWDVLFFTHIKLVVHVLVCVSHASNGKDCITSWVPIITKNEIRKKLQKVSYTNDFCSQNPPCILSGNMYHSISGVAFFN